MFEPLFLFVYGALILYFVLDYISASNREQEHPSMKPT